MRSFTARCCAARRGAVRALLATAPSPATTFAEVAIVAAVATLFSSFSTPFLTAVFTFGVFLVGRSTDLLANLPAKVFGPVLRDMGARSRR
ncbi:MAG: hypothetical protein U0235_19575 [Polyangiaceae bacterium]